MSDHKPKYLIRYQYSSSHDPAPVIVASLFDLSEAERIILTATLGNDYSIEDEKPETKDEVRT